MKRMVLIATILILSLSACNRPNENQGIQQGNLGEEQNPQPRQSESQKRCGDDVCDGPENAENCPQDCSLPAQGTNQQSTKGKGVSESSAQEIQPAESGTQLDTGYRYVSFSGTVFTSLNTEGMGDFSGTAFEYSGKYSIELWFPIEGGEAVQQRNDIVLTEYKDLYFGDLSCTPCEWVLNESAFEPVEFGLDATLNLNALQEDGQPADELVYQLSGVPGAVITGVVQCPCPNSAPDDFTDPSAFTQMLTWFMQKLANPIRLNVLETNSVENYPSSPMGFLNIPRETLSYTIVPDLSTP